MGVCRISVLPTRAGRHLGQSCDAASLSHTHETSPPACWQIFLFSSSIWCSEDDRSAKILQIPARVRWLPHSWRCRSPHGLLTDGLGVGVLGTGLPRGSLADASCPFLCWCDLHSAWGAAQAVIAANLVPEQSPVHPDGAAGTALCAPGKRYGQVGLHGLGPMCSFGEAGFAHSSRAGFPLPSPLNMSPAPGCWCGKHRSQEETVAGLCHISGRR